MTIEEMMRRKRELGYSIKTIAQMSGVPYSTIQKIFSGTTSAPREETIRALTKVLRESKSYPSPAELTHDLSMVEDSSIVYRVKKRGDYTLEDYYAMPDERRVELIDGEIFEMAAPSVNHQMILGELYIQFRACADLHGQACRVFLSPCDVQLDNDDKTMVQPDLFVLCHGFDPTGRSIQGAPELTLEILSDSSRSKDLLLKTYKYKNAGVKEYWIIDPKKKEVLVYDFTDDDLIPERYTFSDQVPVGLSGGKCKIDFALIQEQL
ncbi:MAG: Uma2 family endonuclease [Eubacterium sp.]|nr:Uma2 family endonuclease [Eubacterium sp.]